MYVCTHVSIYVPVRIPLSPTRQRDTNVRATLEFNPAGWVRSNWKMLCSSSDKKHLRKLVWKLCDSCIHVVIGDSGLQDDKLMIVIITLSKLFGS